MYFYAPYRGFVFQELKGSASDCFSWRPLISFFDGLQMLFVARLRMLHRVSSIPICGTHPYPTTRSAQVVPDPATAAVLVQRAAFDQCPEVLFERIAAGPGQFDGFADGDAPMLLGELDDL